MPGSGHTTAIAGASLVTRSGDAPSARHTSPRDADPDVIVLARLVRASEHASEGTYASTDTARGGPAGPTDEPGQDERIWVNPLADWN
jgi:hypothetical protein